MTDDSVLDSRVEYFKKVFEGEENEGKKQENKDNTKCIRNDKRNR